MRVAFIDWVSGLRLDAWCKCFRHSLLKGVVAKLGLFRFRAIALLENLLGVSAVRA